MGGEWARGGFMNIPYMFKNDVGKGGSMCKPLLCSKIKGGAHESACLLQKFITDIFVNHIHSQKERQDREGG